MQSLSATLSFKELPKVPRKSPRMLESVSSIELRCPACHASLGHAGYRSLARSSASFYCGRCAATLTQEQGIWLALPPARQGHFARFVKEYEHIRREEGRGSNEAEFYLALPYRDITGRNSWQWAIRGKTFRYIERRILPKLSRKGNWPLAILDLGAGNGWMSHRLARLGHRPVAVDLLTNSFDGLGAASHYQSVLPELFPRFQAEIDNLPFAAEQFDCAIFNASFHYSENYDRTLGETIRCLRPGGTIVIADSPTLFEGGLWPADAGGAAGSFREAIWVSRGRAGKLRILDAGAADCPGGAARSGVDGTPHLVRNWLGVPAVDCEMEKAA